MKRTTLKRKTPLRRMSRQREAEVAAYHILRRIFLINHPVCEVLSCCNGAQQIHHKAGRNGPRLIDERYIMSVCSSCHNKIHDNPAWARTEGYLA